uniref:CUB domain-containing protein n=1 Tax=Panagrolaimus sp. PS1159 TaxID=55785 RepID=A0AC35GA85_9BILA
MVASVSIISYKIVLFFLILTLTDAVASYETATCSTESINDESHMLNYTLKSDSFMFFQSPNFPQTIYNTSNANLRCKSVFHAENQNQKIWLAMLFGKADIFLSEDLTSECYTDSDCFIEYNSNFDIFTFAINNDMLKFEVKEEKNVGTWKAFQAALVSYELTVPLVSSFYQLNNGTAKKACSWKFTISPTQSLKVVVKNLTIQNNENAVLSLHADNTTIKNFTDDINDEVFYFNGTSFTFNFLNEYNSNTSFFILVSAVQKAVNFTSDGCNRYNDLQSETFSNVNHIKGYPANQYCDNTLIIPENYEGILYISEQNYEFCCDTLSLKYGTNQSYLIGIEEEYPVDPFFQFYPLFYKLTRDVNGGHLIFHSDGNIQGAGYKAVFETFECECADRHLLTSCEETGDYIYPLKDDNVHYCSNMFCEYQIVPNALCPDYYIMIQIDTNINNETDELSLLANGTAIIM